MTLHQDKDKRFPKRHYTSLKSFWGDFRYLMSHRVQIRAAMRSDLVTPVFRERLMMAVTEVNQCRYCRAFHIQQARQAGIPAQEITAFLKGQIPDDVPEDQKLALCYAQHWAENDADPEPEFQDQVREAYGEEGFLAIDTALRMIRMGNLMGNTWDLLLFRISFGKWGK